MYRYRYIMLIYFEILHWYTGTLCWSRWVFTCVPVILIQHRYPYQYRISTGIGLIKLWLDETIVRQESKASTVFKISSGQKKYYFCQ